MKIRAHHLLCMQGFQGYGYSEDFSRNMAKVIQTIESFPKQKIQIVTECDVICSCCPYNINEICSKNPESNKKIKRMDIKVLEKLELSGETILEGKEIFSFVNKKLGPMDVQEICGNCSWKEKCLWFLEKRSNFEF
jgi:hypothetical protein